MVRQTLITNELDFNFLGSSLWCKVSSKLTENCDRGRGDRHTDTDTGEFIICPMLCYSNGTDRPKYQNLVATTSSVRRWKLLIVLNSL